MTGDELKQKLMGWAKAEGFDACGVTHPDAIPLAAGRLQTFLAEGRHGDMAWLETHAERRAYSRALWPDARSVIMLGMNYGPEADPLEILQHRWRGAISVYAQGRDYHDVLKGKLKTIAGKLAQAADAQVKVFVDTAPLMEKPLAQAAGLGWQGKHTNLVSRSQGSWLFLGAILSTADLPSDGAETDHCGSCTRCLDVCPTAAFPAPYQLDARRCIAYLTIEYRGHIPLEFRKAIGNRIYGCDDCLAVCPWNKYAQAASDVRLKARAETDHPALADLLGLDDAAFRLRFAGTPIKRTGRDRFLRNVLIGVGNSGDPSLMPAVTNLLNDTSPLVRAMAVWALRELASRAEVNERARHALARETDACVQAEWYSKDSDR